jgi:putative ABC transport system substrate-binding protein
MGNALIVDDERSIRITERAFPEEDGHQAKTVEKEGHPRKRVVDILDNWFSRGTDRGLWIFLVAMALGLILNGCGEQKLKVSRVGILCGLEVFATTVDGFKAKMAELGYVEGNNVTYDLHKTNFDSAAEESILRKFVADKVDLMLVFPSEVSVAAKAVTQGTNIPVVFCQTNIEGNDLIKSVPEPGGNITGVRYPGPDLALKRFEILHELVPQAKRMWVPYTKNSPIVPDQLTALRPAAAKAGVTLVESPADGAADLIADLGTRAKAADIGIDAVLFISEPLARAPAVFPQIGKFASEHRIPIGGVLYSLEGYSTVFGVATDNIAVGKLAAQQAHKVLRGIPPGTIPVVSAESYFQFNYRVAQELGLSVPDGLLKQADELIR